MNDLYCKLETRFESRSSFICKNDLYGYYLRVVMIDFITAKQVLHGSKNFSGPDKGNAKNYIIDLIRCIRSQIVGKNESSLKEVNLNIYNMARCINIAWRCFSVVNFFAFRNLLLNVAFIWKIQIIYSKQLSSRLSHHDHEERGFIMLNLIFKTNLIKIM